MSGAVCDVVVIGSGFGGSVAALRLAEKGYRVVVVEAGRRFSDDDLPKTSWDLRSFLWAPALGCKGIQRIHPLRDVIVLAGAGVGGGSLNYANTLYEPLDEFYDDPQWSGITDWREELAPFYDQAKRMLGATVNPTMTPADLVMREVAEQMDVGDTFHRTPVGVYFGEPGVTVDDPFFGGAGPRRTGCEECGACMTGCRHGAKNTLTTNYLHLAERLGVRVLAETTVREVRALPEGGYAVETSRSGGLGRAGRRTLVADQVVVAAGAYNTQKLLLTMKHRGVLPGLSDRLGELSRTNSEALLGAVSTKRDVDFTRGVAITSSFHPSPSTHVEPVRYGHGSNSMALLATFRPDGDAPTIASWVRDVVRAPRRLLRALDVRGWSERSIIVLAMQSVDNSLTISLRRGLLGPRMTSRQGHGEPNPRWIREADEVATRAATLIGGVPGVSYGTLVDAPMTAHFIGGCVIGESAAEGVVDPWLRVHGCPGLHVVDGAAVSANLGANPSLTITAQAERAMAFWPNKGDPDPRPLSPGPYRKVEPVAPSRPAVPEGALGVLRLPLTASRRATNARASRRDR
ncbi:MAG: GMC family oxidoreductase [Actinomycetes bacterium]